jgi:transcriptional regulator with XRE-family HTH domain
MNHIMVGNAEVGELIRGYRAAAGLTQEELSEKAEISVRAVRNLEQGLVRCPRRTTLQRLAVALSLDTNGTARFMAVARHCAAPGPSRRLSSTNVVTTSQAWDHLAELLDRMPNRTGTVVLVVQMFICRSHLLRWTAAGDARAAAGDARAAADQPVRPPGQETSQQGQADQGDPDCRWPGPPIRVAGPDGGGGDEPGCQLHAVCLAALQPVLAGAGVAEAAQRSLLAGAEVELDQT